MNPHYNQQQQQHPYYNYQQHVAGPPQPQWQNNAPQSPGGWHDPRFQNPAPSPAYGQPNYGPVSASPTPHAHPPPPPPAGFHGAQQQPAQRPQDNHHRPITPGYDTSQWGVKYNHAQHPQYQPGPSTNFQHESKPALPPRPGSSMAYVAQQQQQQHQQQPPPPPMTGTYPQTPTQYNPQGLWGTPDAQTQDHYPPVPPPRPAAYAAPSQYGQTNTTHDQYSHHPPTHHYDPQPQAQGGWQVPQQVQQSQQQHQAVPMSPPTWTSTPSVTDGSISPIDDNRRRSSLIRKPVAQYIDPEPPSQNLPLPPQSSRPSTAGVVGVKTSSTALGGFGGGPSDWQHYNPLEDDEIEDETTNFATNNAPEGPISASPLQASANLVGQGTERMSASSQSPAPHSFTKPVQSVRDNEKPSQALDSYSPDLGSLPYPPGVERHHSSESTISSVSGVDRQDTIDNIIQAWNAPLTVDSSVQSSLPATRPMTPKDLTPIARRTEMSDHQTQTEFKPQIETKIETRVETKEIEVDPYADIQNEFKATLKRFAGMLRQEAAAKEDEEKFKIFQGFVIRELRLRSVLYGVEASPPEHTVKSSQGQQKAQDSTASRGSSDIAAPAKDLHKSVTQDASLKQQKPPPLDTRVATSTSSRDDSFVVVDAHEAEDEYSPGGRPLMSPLRPNRPRPTVATKGHTQSQSIAQTSFGADESGKISPSLNAPMTLDDYVMPDQPSPSANAPIVVGTEDIFTGSQNTQITGPLNFQPARPVYQPFRYGEGPNTQIPPVQVHGPPMESFAALRQTNAAESGRTLVSDAPPANIDLAPSRGHSKTPSTGRREHEEAFIGLIRAKTQAIRKKANLTPRPESPAILRAGTPSSRSSPSPAPVPPLVKSMQSLRSLIPQSLPPQPGPKSAPPIRVEPIVSALRNLPDDFGFIHAQVLSWDKLNRQVRARQESDRHTRQSENEERIDELFNDNEIGYADIAGLEKDFKLAEAGRKYKEDQEELESFTKGVFDRVVDKLDGEIEQLTKLQTTSIDILDLESVSAAKQVQKFLGQPAGEAVTAQVVAIAVIMPILLEIHGKLEMRHNKIAEATFERERRRKRLELSVLYTNNDKPGIKRLEAEFTKAERLQILEECRKKAERANRMLDSFDRAVVRGLAENQGVIDDVLNRLQLLRDLVMGSADNGPPGAERDDLLYGQDGIRELMDRTSATIDFVLNDSKALVHLLDRADTLSNDADFDLYMSEAKLADASPEKYEKLKSEKAAEDRKVGEELTSRLNGIEGTPKDIMATIREVKDRIGGDAGHEERINKALEAAKMRNTNNSNG